MRSETHTLYYQLYDDIKQKIIHNEFKVGTKLESVRQCAKRLKISTTTVEKAYNQLLIEGYVFSKQRSGFIVQDILESSSNTKRNDIKPIEINKHKNLTITDSLFDIKLYKSISNKVYNYYQDELFSPCNPLGELLLREEIRKHILKERNITCDVNQIVVGPGIQSLLNIILSVTKGKTVSYLTPEFSKAMTIFRGYNYELLSCTSIDDMLKLKSDYVYLSPSNTYPTGDVLEIKERNKLINWARKNNTYIIEDDYNYFIRYNSYTIPSMYSIDNGENVIYMGSFSKTLLPSIRLSYMVLPISLYNLFITHYEKFSQGVSKITQLSIALFMKEGLYQRHTKKLYNAYFNKNEIVIKELMKYQKQRYEIRSTDSNLHVVIDFLNEEIYYNCVLKIDKLQFHYEKIDNQYSIIFPYSGLENEEIPKVIYHIFS
jgi:GntR family transcriptional regulator/MocR family aminotransferase